MKRLVPPDTEFIVAWNSAVSPESAAVTCGIAKRLAIINACRLRRAGFDVKRFNAVSIKAACAHCGKAFDTYPALIKAGRGRYCSRKCAGECYSKNRNSHGESRTRLHQIWCHMKTRCSCVTSRAYAYYGERGISVCNEWRDSYESFRDWAMSNGYSEELEIDRRDTNGNYEPSNCRWATRTEQMRNTRKRANAKTSKYKGVSLHVATGKWKVQVCVPGKPTHRGLFVSEIDAAKEYDRIVRVEFGEHAMTNFKEDNNCCALVEK